ncbi:MAG: hypothetical protein ACFFC3_11370 [Candidatus Odinarchaeota archaeon]
MKHSCPPGPITEWSNTWGGKFDDKLYEMVVDSSDYYYLAGDTWSYGNGSSDIFLVKMNESLIQNVTWGGVESDQFGGMIIDSNNDIYITGSTSSYGIGEKNVFLLKYNNSLDLSWYNIWGNNNIDKCTEIMVDSLDNIYIAGITNYPYCGIFLVKYNSAGDLQWDLNYNTGIPNVSEDLFSMLLDSSDHIFFSVNTNASGSEWFLLKYDNSGTLLLNNSYSKFVPLELLALDSLDNLYAIGSYNNNTYLTKFDNNGNLEWNHTCIKNSLPGAEVLAVDPYDNIVVAGNELINPSVFLYGYNVTDYDTYLMRFNSSGFLKSNFTLSGNNRYSEIIAFDPLGYVYLGGSTEMISNKDLNIFLYIFDNSGTPLWSTGGGWEGDAYCKGIYAKSVKHIIVAECTPRFNGSDYEVKVTKFLYPLPSYCPEPNYTLFFMLHIGLSSVCIITGIYYFIIKKKRVVNFLLY